MVTFQGGDWPWGVTQLGLLQDLLSEPDWQALMPQEAGDTAPRGPGWRDRANPIGHGRLETAGVRADPA